jgi:hypothetical protein
MGFKDINLKASYNSEEDDLLVDFYIPVLSQSVLYQRIAGFFSSNALAVSVKGISGLIENGGQIQMICNVVLSAGDQKAIQEGIKQREEDVLRQIESIDDPLMMDHIRLLAWMVKTGKLELKIAVVEGGGLEHRKLGILQDNNDNFVSFNGSDNETARGWLHNNEQFHVFCSWREGDAAHLSPDKMQFQQLWPS